MRLHQTNEWHDHVSGVAVTRWAPQINAENLSIFTELLLETLLKYFLRQLTESNSNGNYLNELLSLVQSVNIAVARNWLIRLLEALNVLHKNGLQHKLPTLGSFIFAFQMLYYFMNLLTL